MAGTVIGTAQDGFFPASARIRRSCRAGGLFGAEERHVVYHAGMYLVQLLLPVHDNDGKPFEEQTLAAVHSDLFEKFGGLTAYSRAPAEGTWAFAGSSSLDDIVVVEVMTETLETEWWKAFRTSLEHTLRQQRIVVRAHRIEMI